PPPPRPHPHANRAPERPAVPDESRAREQVAEEVILDGAPVLDHVVAARAHDPADEPREDELVGPVRRLAELLEAPPADRGRPQAAEREHDPEGLAGQRAEVDLGL